MKAKTIITLVLVVLLLIVLIQNTQVISLHLLFWKISMSQIILIFLTLLIGLIAGYIVAKMTGGRQSRKDKN